MEADMSFVRWRQGGALCEEERGEREAQRRERRERREKVWEKERGERIGELIGIT